MGNDLCCASMSDRVMQVEHSPKISDAYIPNGVKIVRRAQPKTLFPIPVAFPDKNDQTYNADTSKTLGTIRDFEVCSDGSSDDAVIHSERSESKNLDVRMEFSMRQYSRVESTTAESGLQVYHKVRNIQLPYSYPEYEKESHCALNRMKLAANNFFENKAKTSDLSPNSTPTSHQNKSIKFVEDLDFAGSILPASSWSCHNNRIDSTNFSSLDTRRQYSLAAVTTSATRNALKTFQGDAISPFVFVSSFHLMSSL